MRLFSFLDREPAKAEGLHRDFSIRDGNWLFNRTYTLAEGVIAAKARFGFDDPAQLDSCPFMAKIGANDDEAVTQPWIGFAYASDKQTSQLEAWAARFPFAEIIDRLDEHGVSTEGSVARVISGGAA